MFEVEGKQTLSKLSFSTVNLDKKNTQIKMKPWLPCEMIEKENLECQTGNFECFVLITSNELHCVGLFQNLTLKSYQLLLRMNRMTVWHRVLRFKRIKLSYKTNKINNIKQQLVYPFLDICRFPLARIKAEWE